MTTKKATKRQQKGNKKATKKYLTYIIKLLMDQRVIIPLALVGTSVLSLFVIYKYSFLFIFLGTLLYFIFLLYRNCFAPTEGRDLSTKDFFMNLLYISPILLLALKKIESLLKQDGNEDYKQILRANKACDIKYDTPELDKVSDLAKDLLKKIVS